MWPGSEMLRRQNREKFLVVHTKGSDVGRGWWGHGQPQGAMLVTSIWDTQGHYQPKGSQPPESVVLCCQ